MWSRSLILGVLLAALASAPGCLASSADRASTDSQNENEHDPTDDDGDSAQQCQVPSDCVVAASTCCECPSFALPEGQAYDGTCEDVNCEATEVCPAVEASCSAGQCVMICAELIADTICSFGFERDAAGCLTNECAGPSSLEEPLCTEDSDCVQIPADCCGCSRGGKDQAVPAGFETDAAPTGCPSEPACPEIDFCDPEEVPRCISGNCTLSAPAAEPGGPEPGMLMLCGTPELEVCSDGSQCVLNVLSAKEANDLGVGVCVPE